MKKIFLNVCVLTTLLLYGCGDVIFNANFQSWSYGSPSGPPPGQPADDQIVVLNTNNPVVSGSKLLFHPPDHKALFFSHPVKDSETTKTIFWIGQLKTGDGHFSFLISADNTPGPSFLVSPLVLQFTNNEVKVISPSPSSTVLHSHSLAENEKHEVFISLNPKAGTYRITIQQEEIPEIEFNGNLDPATTNAIKSKSRIVLQAGFIINATSSDQYDLYEVIMRE